MEPTQQPPVKVDQSTVSPASYQLPPKPPVSHRSRNITLIVIGVIIVLLAIAGGLYFFTPAGSYLNSLITPISVPAELQAASFLSDSATGNTFVYQFPSSGKTSTDAGAVIVSESQNGKGSARITRSADGTFRVSLENIVVLQDKVARVGVDSAPDGRSVVFAQASTSSSFVSPAAAPMLGLSNRGWNVVLYLPQTHNSITLGAGASPFFVDATHVAWLSQTGLAVMDLSTGKTTILVKNLSIKVLNTMLVSPDHTIVAWYDSSSKSLIEYKVTATTATALPATPVPAASDTIKPIHSLSLGNDSVYMLRTAATGTELLKAMFGQQPIKVGNVPSTLGIGRLVIGIQ